VRDLMYAAFGSYFFRCATSRPSKNAKHRIFASRVSRHPLIIFSYYILFNAIACKHDVHFSGSCRSRYGNNKGIGYFIALQLGLPGLFQHIILACRDRTRAAAAVESMRAQLPSTVTVRAETLTVGDSASHSEFAARMQQTFGKIDCLVNNAGFAFKGADTTPFNDQTKPTLDTNFRGTVNFTETMLPLIDQGSDPRIVNVASMSGLLRTNEANCCTLRMMTCSVMLFDEEES
jgi:short chain dehydrogenase